MEVHHHGHVHNEKKWKEYLFQFFMLFLAVLCGFFAEYQLEHMIERSKEKEYVQGLIHNLSSDTLQLNAYLARNTLRAKGIDTLITIAQKNQKGEAFTESVYTYFIRYIPYSDLFQTNDATMQQLKNSGALRLIHKGNAADSIVRYDVLNKLLMTQGEYYMQSVNRTMEASFSIMDQTIYSDTSYFKNLAYQNKPLPPLSNEPEKIRFFLNSAKVQSGIFKKYCKILEAQLVYARRLISHLQKQYKISPPSSSHH